MSCIQSGLSINTRCFKMLVTLICIVPLIHLSGKGGKDVMLLALSPIREVSDLQANRDPWKKCTHFQHRPGEVRSSRQFSSQGQVHQQGTCTGEGCKFTWWVRRQKYHYLPDKYFLLQGSPFLALKSGNLPGMGQFEGQDCSHSTLKYGLSKDRHMSPRSDTEFPFPGTN